MKVSINKFLAFALAILLVLSCVACANDPEPIETQETGSSEAITEGNTEYSPNIATKNYDCDFNFVASGSSVNRSWIAIESQEYAEAGDLETAVYERGLKIKDHLGVNLVQQDAGDWVAYAGNVIKTVQSGDDAYQMVLTHVYQGITELITSNALYDIGELEAVNLEAPYWATELMEEIKIDDRYLLGYNDFCLANVYLIVFNKDLMNKYSMDFPYNEVRNKTWTFDKMIEMASMVSVDNGDDKWDETDTYGISGWAHGRLISFISSSDMKIVDRDDTDNFVIAYDNNKEKMITLIDKIVDMYNAEYSYLWYDEPELKFAGGNSLFQLHSSEALVNYRSEDIRFGILPYPLWDDQQRDYKTLNWNGLICVPGTIRNNDMVGEVLELMGYYTPAVETAYYEKLLGSKLAEAPEDAEMLNIIWKSQVSDVGLITCNSSKEMDRIVYILSDMCQAKKANYASFMKRYERSAQKGLDKVFGQ